MNEITIQHSESESKGAFFVEENGKRLAEMTYSKSGRDLIIIDHTEVSDELRGKSVGLKLVHAAVDLARRQHIKIMPLCPFAKSVFDRKSEFRDVL